MAVQAGSRWKSGSWPAPKPAVDQGDNLGASSSSPISDSVSSSCSWQLPGQPPSHHSRSSSTVATAGPWAVWVWRLAS
jgi:hypothetical protein